MSREVERTSARSSSTQLGHDDARARIPAIGRARARIDEQRELARLHEDRVAVAHIQQRGTFGEVPC